MLSMLWHFKVDCNVHLLRTLISMKLNSDPPTKIIPKTFRKPTRALTSPFSKKHLISRGIPNIKKAHRFT